MRIVLLLVLSFYYFEPFYYVILKVRRYVIYQCYSYMRISIRRFQTSSTVGFRGSANASSGISYFTVFE